MTTQSAVIDITPGTQEAQKALTVLETATALVINSKETFEAAKELLLTSKDLQKEIKATFRPIIQKADQAHKEAVAAERKHLAPLLEVEGIIKPRMATFLQEEERIRKAEEDRLRKIAEQEAENRRLEEALSAEADGNFEEAEAILDEAPAFVPPPIVAKTVSTGGGIQMRDNWFCKVDNLMELVKAVASGKVPINAIQANMVFLGQQTRSLKGSLSYPGVVIWKESNIAAGRR